MITKLKKLIISLVAPAFALASPMLVNAGTIPIVPNNLGKTPNIIAVIQTVIRLILIVAFIIAFVMLIVGGIRWILAGGDEKAVASARGTITAALIGLVIVLVTFALIKLIEVFFGVTIISGNVCIPVIGGNENCGPITPGGTSNEF